MLKTTLLITSIAALLTISASAEDFVDMNTTEIIQTIEESNAGEEKKAKKEKKAHRSKPETELLTEDQITDLNYRFEVAKLAKDVYATLATSWDDNETQPIFTIISKSEAKDMAKLERIFTKRGLDLPLSEDMNATYDNEALQVAYDAYISKGDLSRIDALEVAVEIEETTITEVEALLEVALPRDVKRGYRKVLRGSTRHLRMFNRQLKAL